MLRRRGCAATARLAIGALAALGLAASAGCSTKQQRPDVAWRSPPATSPGDVARSDDQAAPRLEGLPPSTARPAPRPAGGGDDLNRAAAFSATANERYAAGDIPAAIAAQRQALVIRERVLGAEHLDVASTLTSLGRLEALQGDYGTAEPLLRRALEIREKALGPDQPAIAESLSNLALVYAAQGRYADAEPLYQRAIAILDKRHDADPKGLAVILENYAALLSDSGRPQGAKALEARAESLRGHPPRASGAP